MNRRQLLQSMGLAGAATLVGTPVFAAEQNRSAQAGAFTFVFFTDTHIQPELDAAKACAMCFHRFHSVPADFAICGGDLVFDAAAVPASRGSALYDLYRTTSAAIPYPVHYTLGNHDVFGVSPKSGVATADPLYGKKLFEDRYGPTYHSFDHKGWHFVVLDSIGIRPDRSWVGEVGAAQREWLKADLEKTGKQTPVLVVSHVPLVTGAIFYVSHDEWLARNSNLGGLIETLMLTDAAAVIDILLGYNVRAVLQGHTHVNEDITFRGLRFITNGAVSGNWWKGTRAGSPEGFSTLHLTARGEVQPTYQSYGFHAVNA